MDRPNGFTSRAPWTLAPPAGTMLGRLAIPFLNEKKRRRRCDLRSVIPLGLARHGMQPLTRADDQSTHPIWDARIRSDGSKSEETDGCLFEIVPASSVLAANCSLGGCCGRGAVVAHCGRPLQPLLSPLLPRLTEATSLACVFFNYSYARFDCLNWSACVSSSVEIT